MGSSALFYRCVNWLLHLCWYASSPKLCQRSQTSVHRPHRPNWHSELSRSLGGSRSRVSSPAAAVICAHIVFCPSSILPRLRSSFQERNGWGRGPVRGRSFSSHHLGSCYVRSLPPIPSSKNTDVCEQRSLTSLIKMKLRSDLLC